MHHREMNVINLFIVFFLKTAWFSDTYGQSYEAQPYRV